MNRAICIDARVLGTRQHLLLDENRQRHQVDAIPKDTWHLSLRQNHASHRCLNTLLTLERFNVDIEPPEVFVSSWRPFVSERSWPPPWQQCMPIQAHQRFQDALINNVVEAFGKVDTRFYEGPWMIQTAVFDALRRATVHDDVYVRLLKENPENKELQSFSPNRKELAKQVVYDRTSTRTGRLTVVQGPEILRLRRDLRSVICPSGRDRVVKTIDFRANEMRVLLYEAGHDTFDGDLYEQFGSVYLPGVPRATVKGAIIRRNYGSSWRVWGPELGLSTSEAQYVNDVLERTFKTKELADRLASQLKEQGFIRDRYHRKVVPSDVSDHILVNSFAQATGNSVALLGFASMLQGFERLDVHPLFVIHDCIVVDAPMSAVKTLETLNTIRIKGYEQRYQVLLEDIVKE